MEISKGAQHPEFELKIGAIGPRKVHFQLEKNNSFTGFASSNV
jgi:hypothetical protein